MDRVPGEGSERDVKMLEEAALNLRIRVEGKILRHLTWITVAIFSRVFKDHNKRFVHFACWISLLE